jgi:PKD repeat protein
MKKIYSFLIVLLAIVSIQTSAQVSCNPVFTFQNINASTVKFNPAITDSPAVQHYWSFNEIGGGFNDYSNWVSPTKTFPTGVFKVKHSTFRYGSNGAFTCRDSSEQTITISQGACLLSANFYVYPSQTNNLQFYYYNYTSSLSPTDSIRWTFGDGTSSNLYNPTHVYANYGIYNVCLRVIKRNLNGTLSNCVSEICKLDTIGYQCNLQAYFTTNIDSATVPALVQFNNQSSGYNTQDSVIWNFGDGTAVSNVVNPSHTYVNPGVYMACLIVKKNSTLAGYPVCRDTFCKMINIVNPCNLLANFTYYRDSLITIPNSYHFTNTTVPLASSDSIRWTFGDGTSSSQVNPNHVYTTPGTYTVCLRVIKRNPNGVLTNCISEKCYPVVISPLVVPCNMQVNFTNVLDSLQSNVWQFTNQTIGYTVGDSLTWTFGDGTSSNQINPNHTYANAGTYVVCLRVKKNNTTAGATPCIREFCKTIVVAVPCTLVANFYSYRDSVTTIPNTYRFINTSAPLAANDSIRWTFGDGTSSSQVNPIHYYSTQGTYTVCLRVIKRNAAGLLTNCVSEKCYIINVAQLCNINATYTWQADSANYKKIKFSNFTVPLAVATALWNFGDGTTATTWDATHTYAQAGRYYVCLRIQYGACISYKCDSITIVAPVAPPTCTQLSLFSTATTNNTVSFAPNFLQPNVQYTWTFGDGTGSQWTNVSHQYFLGAGVYTACLTAFKDINCASTTCKTITIPSTINCNNITLSINDTRDSLVPNRVTFTAVSNTTTISQQWTITRIPTTAATGTTTINTNNPTYVFLDSGYYNVCVKTTYANGCIKTICKYIYIAQPMPGANTCTLQVYPNPASSSINTSVTLVQPFMLNASVYNNMGVLVAQKQQQGVVGSNIVSINIGTLPAGVYTLRMTYGNQICYATFVK